MEKLNHLGGISRRDFFKMASLTAGYFSVPEWIKSSSEIPWPSLALTEIPQNLRSILEIVPKTEVNSEGYLTLLDREGESMGRVPLVQTDWNIQRNDIRDRLKDDFPRGIVLHWFGDDADPERSIQNYLWGFNGVRERETVTGERYQVITSAHFAVGPHSPDVNLKGLDDPLSIVQTQEPSQGEALLASHIQILDRLAYREGRHPFACSLDTLGRKYDFPRNVISVLQDWFRRPASDPSWYTYAIEMAGKNFDASPPSEQETANAISVIWALMKKDKILATNVLGHHEIQLNKIDPGKSYMAQIRLLLGIKALTENDPEMNELIFGPFLQEGMDKKEGVRRYFQFVRDFLVMSQWGAAKKVYDWEIKTSYWKIYDALFGEEAFLVADSFQLPVSGDVRYAYTFLHPENHEGVDINSDPKDVIMGDLGTPILAAANGEVIFAQKAGSSSLGNTVMIKHHLPEGAEVISIYGHLDEIKVEVNDILRKGQELGTMGASGGWSDSQLHFAIAYGATWDTDLNHRPFVPLNVDASWIRNRYINPLEFINQRNAEEKKSWELRERLSPEKNLL